jgi:antitoxin (DNA-binding transcriptional repressor) of toxin-antitoxin stability system
VRFGDDIIDRMTDHGTHISVDANDTDLAQLLRTVAEGRRPVRILSGGTPVAELSPLPPRARTLGSDPMLKATFLCEGEEPMTEEDWPEHLRIDVPGRPAGDPE